MKKFYILSLLTLLLNVFAFSQVDINRPINLSNTTPANARVMGIKQVTDPMDAVSAEVLQKGSLLHGTVTGGTNTYTLTFSPAISTPYAQGMVVTFKASGDNTAAVTLNGFQLRKNVTDALAGGDIKDGQLVTVAYDGANFQLQSRTSDASVWVPTTRTISTTAPLTGGGNLSADRTLAITQATTSSNGYLSSTDWNTFNAKESALTFSNGLTRSSNAVTWGGALTGNTTIAQTDKTLAFTSTVTNGFSVDGTTFSVDAATNMVGIGTAVPSQMLHVTANIRKDFTASSGGTSAWLIVNNDGAGNWHEYINTTGSTAPTLLTEGSAFHRIYTANTVASASNIMYEQYSTPGAAASAITWLTYLQVDAVNNRVSLLPSGGNVGIGLTAPAHRLTVVANGQSNAAIGARGAGANTLEWGHSNTAGYGSAIGYQNGNGHPFIAFSAEAGTTNNTYRTRGLVGTVIKGDIAGGLSINAVATATADNQTLSPLVTVLSSGNVGIGSAATSPDRPLTIVNGTEWNIVSRSTNSTPTNRNHVLFQRANGASAVTLDFNLGGIAMGGYDGSAYSYGWNGGAEISAFANQTFTAANRGTYLALFTTPDNTAIIKEQMRIGADGIISLTTGVNTVRGYFRAVESTEYNGANAGNGFVIATSGGENITFKDNGVGGDVNMSISGTGTVTIPTLGASGNVQVYADNSGNLFKASASTPAAGSVVQMKAVQTRTQDLYSSPTSGIGTKITPLDIVITPKKAGNAMVLQWVVNGEMHYNNVYTVTRDGVLLANATDGTNRWSGVAAQPYDNNQSSTPSNTVISIIDFSTLSTQTTYSVHVRSSENAATLYLNRTFDSAGGVQYESTISTGTATEIQQ